MSDMAFSTFSDLWFDVELQPPKLQPHATPRDSPRSKGSNKLVWLICGASRMQNSRLSAAPSSRACPPSPPNWPTGDWYLVTTGTFLHSVLLDHRAWQVNIGA